MDTKSKLWYDDSLTHMSVGDARIAPVDYGRHTKEHTTLFSLNVNGKRGALKKLSRNDLEDLADLLDDMLDTIERNDQT